MPMIIDGTNGGFFPSWTTATRPASPAVGQMGYNTTIGQFDAYTSGGWVSVATTTSTSNKLTTAQMPVGSVLQVVNAVVGYVTSTSGTNVDTGLTASITPSSATSKILVNINLVGVTAVAATGWGFELDNASNTALYYLANYNTSTLGVPNGYSYSLLFSPATTSSLTYKVRYYVTGSGSSIRLSDYAASTQYSTITLMEIAG